MASRRDLIQQHFSDVQELAQEDATAGFGALGGLGAANHYSVNARLAPDGSGMVFTVVCDNCGSKNNVTIFWQELIIVAHARKPNGWTYQNGRLYPETGCANSGCGYLTTVQLTPDEAGKYVKSGIAAGKLPAQHVQAIAAQLQQRG